ncbi:MAG: HD domain-containing phosphohydrolase [Anaerolineales bacterium]
MARILLVEDDEILRQMTHTILQVDGHEVFDAENGREALGLFSQVKPDLVVSDISMPGMDGFSLLSEIRKLPDGSFVPFLFLTALSEKTDLLRARELGVDDYITKPFNTNDLLFAVRGRIQRRKMAMLFDTREAHLQTITMLANAVEARDVYTHGHVERVQGYAMALGRALGFSHEEMLVLEYGSLLHDIGKISIPDHILNKSGPLTPEEQVIMRQHTIAGAKLLEGIDHLRGAVPYVLYHHERWDGTGYPKGLAGVDIPREGRLLAIVDVFDALTTCRPYHAALPVENALAMIRQGSGSHFDPEMVKVFLSLELHAQKG